MINYNIQGADIEITPELRSYAEGKLAGADKFLGDDPTAHADIELEYSQVRDGGKYRCEFTVSAGSAVYRAEVWGMTMHEAIDLAIEELLHELRRDKTKRRHVFRRGAARIKEYLRGWREKI